MTFTSPIEGVVADKNVVEGAAVTAGQRALRVVDQRVVWLEARLYESDIGAVSIGAAITATVAALPGETFTGNVVFVAPQLDPVTRTMLVRIEIDNDELRLKPGMFASSTLEVAAAERTAVVPREAVIDTGIRSVAFVALGEGRFEPREVETGTEGGDGEIQVLKGLRPGERVVTRGQFLLDSESRMREAVQKFLEKRAEPAEAPVEPEPAAPEPEHYTCPMHPEVHDDGPGSCPICKMDLVPSKDIR